MILRSFYYIKRKRPPQPGPLLISHYKLLLVACFSTYLTEGASRTVLLNYQTMTNLEK